MTIDEYLLLEKVLRKNCRVHLATGRQYLRLAEHCTVVEGDVRDEWFPSGGWTAEQMQRVCDDFIESILVEFREE